MEWEAIRVLNGDFVAPPGSIDLLDLHAEFLCRGIEVFPCLRLETTTTEFGLIGFLADVDVLIGTVSAEVDSSIVLLNDMHAEIKKEFPCLCKVGVAIGLAMVRSPAMRRVVVPYVKPS